MRKLNQKTKVLVIEDDLPLSFFITKKLEQLGYSVDTSNDGVEGLNKAMTNEYSLMIVDVGLPQMSGYKIIEKTKEEGLNTPAIVITNDPKIETEIKAYKAGSNVFHKKPINFDLFETQVKSIIKYYSGSSPITNKVLYIEPDKHLVQKEGETIKLSKKEFKILVALVGANGNVLSRPKLLNHTFKGIRDLEEGSIDTLVCRLRKKLGKYRNKTLIETIHGEGYRFNPSMY